MKEGDYIKLIDSESEGTIVRILSAKMVEVAMENGFVMKVDIRKIENSTPTVSPATKSKAPKKPSITIPPSKVDLHIDKLLPNFKGMSNFDIVQHQLNEFEHALDRAIASGMLEITFVHGIGAGILRQEIRKRLENNKEVKSFMDAHYDRGATVVKFY